MQKFFKPLVITNVFLIVINIALLIAFLRSDSSGEGVVLSPSVKSDFASINVDELISQKVDSAMSKLTEVPDSTKAQVVPTSVTITESQSSSFLPGESQRITGSQSVSEARVVISDETRKSYQDKADDYKRSLSLE